MNRNIFSAWYCLALLATTLVGYFAFLPFFGPLQAQWAFGGMGLLGLLPVLWYAFFRKEIIDERDRLFLQRAFYVGMSNGFSVTATITVILVVRFSWLGIKTVPLILVGVPLLCGVFSAMIAASVVLLLLYYKGETADKEHGF